MEIVLNIMFHVHKRKKGNTFSSGMRVSEKKSQQNKFKGKVPPKSTQTFIICPLTRRTENKLFQRTLWSKH